MKIERHPAFDDFVAGLRDKDARRRILSGVNKLTVGIGKTKRLSSNLSELIFDFGPGWRVYFTRQGDRLILLLGGSSKRHQQREIEKAQARANEV